MGVAVRDATNSDLRFVVGSWVRSLRDDNCGAIIPYHRWYEIMNPIVRELVESPLTRVRVLFSTEAVAGCADILGYVAFRAHVGADKEPAWPLVLFLYVKKPHRRRGLARILMGEAGVTEKSQGLCAIYDHRVLRQLRDKLPQVRWTPRAVRRIAYA